MDVGVEELLVDVVNDGFTLYLCGPKTAPNALVASYEWDHSYVDLLTIQDFARVITARQVVDSVWDTLAAVKDIPRLRAALRFVLIHHEPTPAGRCRACRRMSWRGLWRRRRFPCVVWHQIRGELLGHLTLGGVHRRRR